MRSARIVEARLDHLSAGIRPWVLLVLLSLALFVPGITALPPVDRDEARYIQATRQMLETGDFVRIRFQDEARNKKPAGVYWLQASAVALFSTPQSKAVWPYRLVSLIGATAAVLLTFAFGSAIFDRRTALVGAALLASTADLAFEAHMATTDALLLACSIAAQGILSFAYLSARRGESMPRLLALAFWAAQGLAILVKGPVLPALSLITAGALVVADRRAAWLRALRPAWGIPVLLAIVFPWFVLIERQTQGAFLREALGHDFLGKVAGGQEAHGAPPGYYLALLPVTFWPASLFVGAAAVWAWRGRRLAASRLLTAWIVPFWILLELMPTKLPHYVLPLYPALALAAARAAIALDEDGMAQPPVWNRMLFPALWVVVGLGLGGSLFGLPIMLRMTVPWAGGVALAAACAAAWQVMVAQRGRLGPASVGVAIATALIIYAAGFGLILPRLDPIWLSREAAQLASTLPPSTVSVSGYAEPSLVFLLGTRTRLLPAPAAAEALGQREVGAALVAAPLDAAFRSAFPDNGPPLTLVGSVSGFDYSNGKWLTLNLYRLGG